MSSPPVITTERLTVGYGRTRVLTDISLRVRGGEITTIVGPNGCGKSTLLRTIAGLHPPQAGAVRLGDRPLVDIPRREFAQQVSMLPQAPIAPPGMTVRDLVARGRQPHRPWYRQWSLTDEQIAQQAIAATGMADHAETDLDELSGGQRQRAWIALCLAQQAPTVLLDEPTTFLDLAHAVEVLDVIAQLARGEGKTVVMVLHDLTLAARYSDRLVLLADERVYADGHPNDVLTTDLLLDVFSLNADVVTGPRDGLPVVVPIKNARS